MKKWIDLLQVLIKSREVLIYVIKIIMPTKSPFRSSCVAEQVLSTIAEYKHGDRVGGEERSIFIAFLQRGPQQANAFKTVSPFLGSWKRSYSFRMEMGLKIRVKVDVVLHSSFLPPLAMRSLGLASGDSKTGSDGPWDHLSVTFFWNEDCSLWKGNISSWGQSFSESN